MEGCQKASPVIKKVSWGKLKVEGIGQGKDYKLWPGGGRLWDWSETGMQHDPGIQPIDVQELLNHECEILVLSQGMNNRLSISTNTIEYLQGRGITVHVDETNQAVKKYNQLAKQGKRVGGLFHSTC